MSSKISISAVDEIYADVRDRFGVLGGKIIGAGGGGFLMLYSPRDHAALERFMEGRGMPRLHYTVEPEGTKVVAQMGHGFLSSQQSLSLTRSSS
jgi:D-glycero-alpha-D-manno-heptose-7-phosphate kinase